MYVLFFITFVLKVQIGGKIENLFKICSTHSANFSNNLAIFFIIEWFQLESGNLAQGCNLVIKTFLLNFSSFIALHMTIQFDSNYSTRSSEDRKKAQNRKVYTLH